MQFIAHSFELTGQAFQIGLFQPPFLARLIPGRHLETDHNTGNHDDEFQADSEPVLVLESLGDTGKDHGASSALIWSSKARASAWRCTVMPICATASSAPVLR